MRYTAPFEMKFSPRGVDVTFECPLCDGPVTRIFSTPRAGPNGRVENRCFMFCASIGWEEQKLSLDTLKGRCKARAECTFQCTANTMADHVFDIYYNVLDGPKPPRARRHSNTSGGSAASGGSTASSGGSRGSTGSGSRKRARDKGGGHGDRHTAPAGSVGGSGAGGGPAPVAPACMHSAVAVAGIGAAMSGIAAVGLTEAGMLLDDDGDDDYCVIVE
ncbi:hypothetical protein VOLCADRAFT_103565 [Volvox carteri f. nagariensis]|uniref:Uncharacterized protein n=1 Tax=Volvox carteri f. nagariensis TaxID=3068 RepID=D8TMT9_VOLCA|nr:uncharacterized protein VOLCADRAFT_103565 [Volvox carteri f. nagariensis]EFJ51311.1 hypothetical protein VOLCADRAFT_103565 [Volvox carteri f. nagariensis]|eukprot:XP_002947778.1 hypothetical protein VOLCADRAFT_103565 [Volvox carteri f. nagariensis]